MNANRKIRVNLSHANYVERDFLRRYLIVALISALLIFIILTLILKPFQTFMTPKKQ